MTTIPDPLKLARGALARIDVATVGAEATNSRDVDDWRDDIDGIQQIARAAIAAIDALPASVPSGEPAEFDGRVIVGHAGHRGGWCVFEETAPDEFVPIKGPFATRQEADAAMRDGAAPAAPAPAPMADPMADLLREACKMLDRIGNSPEGASRDIAEAEELQARIHAALSARTLPPADPERVWWMTPPEVIAFWCEFHFQPKDCALPLPPDKDKP